MTGIRGDWGTVEVAGLVRVSFTKLRILRLVETRPRTVGEAARAVGVHKSAAHKHLQSLVAQGCIERRECGRWVYYHSTTRGRRTVAALLSLPGMPDVHPG